MREEHLKKFVPITFYSPLSNCAAGSKNALLFYITTKLNSIFITVLATFVSFRLLKFHLTKLLRKGEKLNNLHCEMRQTIESVKACPHAPHKVEYFYIITFYTWVELLYHRQTTAGFSKLAHSSFR